MVGRDFRLQGQPLSLEEMVAGARKKWQGFHSARPDDGYFLPMWIPKLDHYYPPRVSE